MKTVGFILFLGILALITEITLLFVVLRWQAAKPLNEFVNAAQQIAAMDFNRNLAQYKITPLSVGIFQNVGS